MQIVICKALRCSLRRTFPMNDGRVLTKTLLRVMRLTAIILLIGTLHLSAATKSQTISFAGSNISIQKVFQEIKRQTGFYLVSSKQLMSKASPVTDFLDIILNDQPLRYTIKGKNILLSAKPVSSKGFVFPGLLSAVISVQGQIANELGEPVIATILLQGSTRATTSDVEGNFEIKGIEPNAILLITATNIEPMTVAVNNRSTLRITVKMTAASLNEVTVNAGYYSVKEKERTGSIARITSKEIEKQPVTNFLAAMQGRMAGVQITTTSGIAGAGFDIRIRGQNSLRDEGNTPLYIIDGVPYSSESLSTNATNLIYKGGSPLNSINPLDIESIEVLKDADATAIYGSRGANGVVLITTKKGKSGTTQFSANVSRGIGKVTHFLDLMNTEQYLEMRREAFANSGIPYGPSDYDVNGTWDQTRYTDWQKELFGGTADYADVQAGLGGGSAQTQFLISGNYHKETSVFPGQYNYKKGTFRTNLTHSSADNKLKINLSAGYTAQINSQPQEDIAYKAISLPPNAPALYDEKGNLNWENSTWENPLANLNAKTRAGNYDLITSSQLSYVLPAGFEIKLGAGFSDLRNNERRTEPQTTYDPAYGLGSEYSYLHVGTAGRQSWILEPQLSWDRALKRSRLNILIGGSFQQQRETQLTTTGYGFATNDLINNMGAANLVYNEADNQTLYKYQAFFGRLNWVWDKRMIINLTGRTDGSSRFGPGRQFGQFGAVGAAWLFTNEKFMQSKKWISSGKLRASYGTTGNDQIGDYQFIDTYSTTGNNYLGINGLQPTRLYNPDFGWETNRKLEVALETGFVRDRLLVTLAWYQNRSSSQLVGIPLPGTTGFTSLLANLGATVQNMGVEWTLRAAIIQQRNFTWTASVNLSVSRNKLLSFPGLEASTYRNRYVIGKPLNISKRYHYLGINSATGIFELEDVNKDGRLTSVEDKQTLTDFSPAFFGGVVNHLTLGAWELDFLWQFSKQRAYGTNWYSWLPGGQSNQPVGVLDRWQKPGDDAARFQQYSTMNGPVYQAFANYQESDAAIANAFYWKLKNLSLAYSLKTKWMKDKPIRIYVQAQNVVTISPFNGRDPELRYDSALPPLTVITAGIQFTL
jgi:TonB-linked SusC/RagA family outer membrane protein